MTTDVWPQGKQRGHCWLFVEILHGNERNDVRIVRRNIVPHM
jgi:hypothetical protein